MAIISEINPETAPASIQKIIADHLAEGHALTAEKRTLLHNAAAFNAVEAGSYALDDEPTSALDPELTREVLNTITQLAADGLTLVVVTHEMGFARNVSDRIIFMENGIVAEEAPAKEFFLHSKQEASKRFLRTVTDDFDYSI